MTGTSHGMSDNTIPDAGFPQRTHFDQLSDAGFSWNIYYSDNQWMVCVYVAVVRLLLLARG